MHPPTRHFHFLLPLLASALAVWAAGLDAARPADSAAHRTPSKAAAPSAARKSASHAGDSTAAAIAVFAGGSFWALEPVFENLPGVDSAVSGYTGGLSEHPDFESVTSGNSDYVEAVEVYYHPRRIRFAALLDAYWRNIDPTRADGQFSDSGPQYRPVLFYGGEAEKAVAAASRMRLEKSKRFRKPIVVQILPAAAFHRAEAEHQDYYRKSAGRYRAYTRFSGREAFLKKAWGGKSPAASGKPAALSGKPAE